MLQYRNQRSQRFDYPILRKFFFCSLANFHADAKNCEIYYIEFKAIAFEYSMTLFKLHFNYRSNLMFPYFSSF